ncbi:ParB N-terminal domain-containing protein [Streptomyces pratensis]|uniref:ParB N-terminal domain-containing protein n=1 Tax=Streptomyces pratensis TaxID=1169025 RepID=UPI00301978CD
MTIVDIAGATGPVEAAGHRPPARTRQLTAVSLVPLSALQPADSPRRAPENADHLRALVASDEPFPPIVVHRQTMRVIDGTYRLRAAVLRNRTDIEVRFFDGSAEDAFVYALETNTRHGLPLTFAERSAAAERILRSHPHWADRAIASAAGLSAHTVAGLRRAAAAEAPAPERLGRDGRVRPLSTAQGRREAQRLLTGSSDISLREIARRTGLSPATVRDVRNRMLRGEDPVPERQRAGEREQARPRSAPAPVPAPQPAERRAPAPADEDLADVYRRLCRDPALRQSETGRTLLRLLGTLTLSAEQWQNLAAELPVHRVEAVAALAAENARLWGEFAQRARTGRRGRRPAPVLLAAPPDGDQ